MALLKNGGAVFVWQGGVGGFQHIYARFLTSSNTFLTTTDVVVSMPTNNFQINPAVAVLNNSNVVVVWGSFDQAGSNSMQDVYGQIFSQTGQKIGSKFLINQFTVLQPAHAGGGGAGQRRICCRLGFGTGTVNRAQCWATNSTYYIGQLDRPFRAWTFMRGFTTATASPPGGEFLVNTNASIPARIPSVAAASDGSFMVAWCGARHGRTPTNGWDIYARPFSSAGVGGSDDAS